MIQPPPPSHPTRANQPVYLQGEGASHFYVVVSGEVVMSEAADISQLPGGILLPGMEVEGRWLL